MKVFKLPQEFDWDAGNRGKNLKSHSVSDKECEEVFFDLDKKILKDVLHSGVEPRYILLGATKAQRILFLAFAIRKKKVRVISARDLNKREQHLYEAKNENSKI